MFYTLIDLYDDCWWLCDFNTDKLSTYLVHIPLKLNNHLYKVSNINNYIYNIHPSHLRLLYNMKQLSQMLCYANIIRNFAYLTKPRVWDSHSLKTPKPRGKMGENALCTFGDIKSCRNILISKLIYLLNEFRKIYIPL